MNRTWRRPATLVLGLAAALASVGCATPVEGLSGYTCCNLRSNAGWISSDNYQAGDLVPAGQVIKMVKMKRQYYLYGTIGGYDYGLRADSSVSAADTLQWVRRIIVEQDPQEQLRRWPSDVRTAIGAARVMIGMTRPQVAMAIGFPSPGDTPKLEADTWRYWPSVTDDPVDLQFAADGTLAAFSGQPMAIKTLEMQR